MVERDWFLDKWKDEWNVEFSTMCRPATVKDRDLVIRVEGGGVSGAWSTQVPDLAMETCQREKPEDNSRVVRG